MVRTMYKDNDSSNSSHHPLAWRFVISQKVNIGSSYAQGKDSQEIKGPIPGFTCTCIEE